MRLIMRLFLAVVLGAGILSACESPEAVQTIPPKAGGVLREGLVALTSTDPARAQSVSERQMVDQLYDGLTTWNPTTLAASPALAKSWTASDDQKHFTFLLRDDARAANGEAITASDVKRSLEQVARKSVGSLSTDLLSVIYGFSDFTVNDAIPALEGIVVVDGKTLRFDLDVPFGDLPLLLGNVTLGVTHYGASDQTYTTGPYMIKTITDPTHIVFGKVPGSTGLLDAVNVTYYADVNASYEAFSRNEVDWTPVAPDRAADAAKAYGAQLYRTSLALCT